MNNPTLILQRRSVSREFCQCSERVSERKAYEALARAANCETHDDNKQLPSICSMLFLGFLGEGWIKSTQTFGNAFNSLNYFMA